MITSNTTSDPDSVRYFLVQHVADLFRREARNVGVIVEHKGDLAARFYGERPDGELDGRVVRSFQYPSVYKQWVRYWRRVLEKKRDSLVDSLTKANGAHFNVVDGGAVTGIEGDSIQAVCSYVYSMLVSEGGLAEALGRSKDEEAALENLRFELNASFKELEILATVPSFMLPHPIQSAVPVRGEKESHLFSFIQRRPESLVLIEPVNFITRQQMAARDHAGWTAMAFEDVRKTNPSARPISVIRPSSEDSSAELLVYATRLLEGVSDIVDWSDMKQRSKFLEERREAAVAA